MIITLRCNHCGGIVKLDYSHKHGTCIHCGTDVLITDDVIHVEMSLKEVLNNTKPLAIGFFDEGDSRQAMKETENIISLNAADSVIWLINGLCRLDASDYPLSEMPENARCSLKKYSILSKNRLDDEMVKEMVLDRCRLLAGKGNV